MFYSWECVSLVLGSYTADFVIKDMREMMYLLHVLQHRTMQEPVPGQKGCLRGLKVVKVKMKLSYECWRLQLRMQDLFYSALKETLSEMRLLALYKLQRMVARAAPADAPASSESNILSNLLGVAGNDLDRKSSLRSRVSKEDSAFADH